MKWRPGHLAAAAALWLAACAAAPPVTQPVHTFPEIEARQTFSVGYRQISDRYLEKLSVRSLAIEGIKGLNAIDPEFSIAERGEDIVIRSGSRDVRQWPAPGAGDADAWSRLTVDAIAAARRHSPGLGAAATELLYESVFEGSISLLDSFSRYSGAEKAKRNRERRSGFGGIGIRFSAKPEGAHITEVFDGAPAARAMLLQGDIITHVDGQSLADIPRQRIAKLIKGAVGSTVELRFMRAKGAEPIEISIRRARIIAPTVYLKQEGGVLFARIKGFNKRTSKQLSGLLAPVLKHRRDSIRGIVLDLRSNPGGLLSQAVKVADLFLGDGRIVSTKGRPPASLHAYNAHATEVARDLPMVVLINGRSASASEIVAAALQDHERALVIGSASFGKGTVQTVIALPNKGELILTWSRFITPSGYVLNGLGVPPYICTSVLSGTVPEMVDATVSNAPNLTRMLERWRGSAKGGLAEKKRLKSICPASDQRADFDGRIAEYLIANRDAYQRVLSLSPTIASAEKP